MRELDETDLEILQLLLSNARRPYREIADAVGLSAPAVSDRVDRLRETGVIDRFTLDVDRSQLREGTSVLVTVEVDTEPREIDSIREALLDADAVDHVFTTAAGDFVVHARVADADVAGWIADTLEPGTVEGIEVTLLSGADWSPDPGGTAFALSCAECGNTVDSEGTATRLDGELYQFCCPNCEDLFREQYEQFQRGTD